MARNRAIDYLRSAGGRERNAARVRRDRPSRALHRHGARHSALRQRPPREVRDGEALANQRQVIELAYFEGLSQTEMAERMGQPLGTVKTWVRAALKNLRDELGAVVPA